MATRLFEELEALSACVREFARFPRYTAISFISPLREEDAPLKYRHGSRPRNSLLSGFRCSSNPPPPARRTRLITRSDDVSNFFTGFSNCETPTRYQATTDSSNSVISRVKRSGAWRAIARCHARNVAPSVKRACKTVNHRAFSGSDQAAGFSPDFLLPWDWKPPDESRSRDAVQRNERRAIRHGRAVTRKRIVKHDNLSMRGDGILV